MTLKTATGTRGMLLLTGFVTMMVGGVLATVEALQATDGLRFMRTDAVVVLALGILAIVGALLVWREQNDTGGILGIIAAVVFLVYWPQTAGLLALVGGVLALAATRIVPRAV